MANNPAWWDPYSCQPYKLPPSEKPRISGANLAEYLRILTTVLATTPAIAWKYFRQDTSPGPAYRDLIGLGINADPQWQSAHQELVEELGVTNLMTRIGVWQLDELDNLAGFLDRFPDHDLMVNILQSRESVRDPEKWKHQVNTIIQNLSGQCRTFQIGNAVNRSKWGCRNSGEALKLFEAANHVRNSNPGIRLLGSSVIDFEPLITLRTLFNFHNYHFEGCATQMYVNRRGSPFGRQYRYFDLERKLRLIKSVLDISCRYL